MTGRVSSTCNTSQLTTLSLHRWAVFFFLYALRPLAPHIYRQQVGQVSMSWEMMKGSCQTFTRLWSSSLWLVSFGESPVLNWLKHKGQFTVELPSVRLPVYSVVRLFEFNFDECELQSFPLLHFIYRQSWLKLGSWVWIWLGWLGLWSTDPQGQNNSGNYH